MRNQYLHKAEGLFTSTYYILNGKSEIIGTWKIIDKEDKALIVEGIRQALNKEAIKEMAHLIT